MTATAPGFFGRLWMALVCFLRIVFFRDFAARVWPAYQEWATLPPGQTALPAPSEKAPAAQVAPAAELPPERQHASGLWLLSVLQREGRFLDFLQEDVAPYSDQDVGAAARIVHEGCRKIVRQYLSLEPVLKESEGARVTVPPGFDAQRFRLTGNVTGEPPFSGALKHHGWVVSSVRLPPPPTSLDLRVLAPAEVEL